MDAARKIENLLYTYAERIDGGDLEGVADLFTHGRIAMSVDASMEESIVGRDAVLAMYQSSTRLYPDTGTPLTRHLTTNVIIEVDDGATSAKARTSYCVVQATEVLPLQPIIVGRYTDSFQLIDDQWWFDLRVMHIDLQGDLSQHLLYEL